MHTNPYYFFAAAAVVVITGLFHAIGGSALESMKKEGKTDPRLEADQKTFWTRGLLLAGALVVLGFTMP